MPPDPVTPPATPTGGTVSGPLPATLAGAVEEAFDTFRSRFQKITRRARTRFEERDWRGTQEDAVERLLLYRRRVLSSVEEARRLVGPTAQDIRLWSEAKVEYARATANRDDCEIARTYFNSVSRRVLGTVGVRPEAEFLGFELDGPEGWGGLSVFRGYDVGGSIPEALREVLDDLPLSVPLEDADRDARLAASVLEADLPMLADGKDVALEVLPALFYRNKAAYLVGRIRRGTTLAPMLLALLHGEEGVAVDAVLTTSDEASIVFGFSRSYFHAEVRRPRAAVDFLSSIMPLKRTDELYSAIGYDKHGKTELYRDLQRHLKRPEARFVPAPGAPGMVMSVFTLPSLNIVFKVIRDRFAPEKRGHTRARVKDRYRLVFVRDRVGRLADTQEFEGLEFPASLFAGEVLEELLEEAPSTVRVEGDRVVIDHLYTVRRMRPLDMYIREAPREDALEALLDYGYAIKDLAVANIFPGDMLFKNFGVTRHGRVIFYDYDELVLLTECNFREIPEPLHPEDELRDGCWFHVGDRDIFPEEFGRFLGFPPGLREPFMEVHGDLLEVGFWREMKARQEAGEVPDFFPYRQSRRLRQDGDSTRSSGDA